MKELPMKLLIHRLIVLLAAGAAIIAGPAAAQQPPTATGAPAVPAWAPGPSPHPMTFFVTSEPIGKGGNLGGLAGADTHCQALAAAAGRGNATWHAYLSTQGPGAVNARDRIGKGPWYNKRGFMIAESVAQLHGDTLEQARLGIMLGRGTATTEKGAVIPGFGDTPNHHDILTGTMPDGRAFSGDQDRTCKNWVSSAEGTAQLGHVDKNGGGNGSWNSSHPSRSCSQEDLVKTGGIGLIYCFAIDD
jgi:hypothetical protein